MYGQANVYAPSQLQIAEIVKTALANHYKDKKAPEVLNKLNIKRKTIFMRKFIGGSASAAGNQTHMFFEGAVSDKPYDTNWLTPVLPDGKFLLIFGISGKAATGAAAGTDAMDTLPWSTIDTNNFLNGTINLEINGKKVLEREPVKEMFINNDAVDDFCRLPKVCVLEPNENIKLQLDLAKSYASTAYEYAEFALHTILLEA